jgi:hypothetical protein
VCTCVPLCACTLLCLVYPCFCIPSVYLLSNFFYFYLLTLSNQVGPDSERENFFNDNASFEAYLDLLDGERPYPLW